MTFLVTNKRKHSPEQSSDQGDLPVSKKPCLSPPHILHSQTNYDQYLVTTDTNQIIINGSNCKYIDNSQFNSPSSQMNPLFSTDLHRNQTIASNIYSYYQGSPMYSPSLTMEQNPLYFNINKVLFEAHLESISRRQGYMVTCRVE